MMKLTKKVLLVGIFGTILQWYDFGFFGYCSAIIAKTFFPHESPVAALIHTFTVFAIGYLLAPLGSFIFGFIGDTYGRKKALTLSLLTMSLATLCIGILPGCNYLGVFSSILLALFRIAQGMAASAEFSSSAIFLVEHATDRKKALYGCLTSSAYSIGSMLAGLVAAILTASFMPDWSWRLGFVLACIGGLIVYYLRLHIEETPDFKLLKSTNKSSFPFKEAIRYSGLQLVGVIGVGGMIGIVTFGTYIFIASYLHTFLNISLSLATSIVIFGLLIDALLEPFIASLADRIGYLPIIKIGIWCLLLFSYPIFLLFSSSSLGLMMAAMALISVIIAVICAPMNAYLILLFPIQYRSSAFGTSFQTGVSLIGDTTPLILMWLIHKTNSLVAPAFYYIIGASIGFISLYLCNLKPDLLFNKSIMGND